MGQTTVKNGEFDTPAASGAGSQSGNKKGHETAVPFFA